MPVPISGRVGEIAFAKQTAEGTAAGSPTYGLPFAGGGLKIPQEIAPFEVTDVSQVEVIAEYKQMMQVGGSFSVVAVPDALGLLARAHFGAETVTGAADPVTHDFTYGADDAAMLWMTFFQNVGGVAGSASYSKFTDCKVDSLAFSYEPGRPILLEAAIRGKSPESLSAAYTAPGIAEGLAEVFTYAGSTMKFDEDSAVGVQHRNIVSAKVTFKRSLVVQQTDDIIPQYVFSPTFGVDVEMTMWWEDAAAIRATYFGAVGGLTKSRTVVYGSLDFLSLGTPPATQVHSLQLLVPKVALKVELPEAVPSGEPIALTVAGRGVKPATAGQIGQIKLINAKLGAY